MYGSPMNIFNIEHLAWQKIGSYILGKKFDGEIADRRQELYKRHERYVKSDTPLILS